MPKRPPTNNAVTCIKVHKINKKKGPRVYDTQRWRGPRGIRRSKLSANPLCEHCQLKGIVKAASQVDHIDGDETNMEFDNLQSLCASCHSKKTVKENGGFGKYRECE